MLKDVAHVERARESREQIVKGVQVFDVVPDGFGADRHERSRFRTAPTPAGDMPTTAWITSRSIAMNRRWRLRDVQESGRPSEPPSDTKSEPAPPSTSHIRRFSSSTVSENIKMS